MTDISKEAVERLAKTADLFASAMKAFQHHTKKHNEDVRDTLRAQAAHIAAQDAKIAKLVEALRNIAIADIQQMRVDDCLREAATVLSIVSIGETDD
jgi:chorismate mutase